jgi:4-oxalocrotonate tautomerase
MPIVQIDMLEGRSLEQKRALVEKVTDAITESVNCPKEAVTIIIREMATQNLGKAGKLKIDQK